MEEYDNGNTADVQATGQEELADNQMPATEYADAGAFVSEAAPGSSASRATLVLAGLVVAGAAAVYFMHLRSGPKSAVASPEAATASATINKFLSEGDRNMKLMRDLLKNTEKIVQQFLNYPSMAQVRLEELKTNPFRLSKPRETAGDEDAARRQRELELAKKKEKEAVLQAVGRLKLQSVIHSGTVRTCVISGRTYTENQEVEGFVIERIQPDAVVVRKSGYRFELRMNR